MLSREGVDADWLVALAARGTRFVGSRTTRVFCLPTCLHARRVREPNRVQLRSEGEARKAGFRPCPRCRPVEVASSVS
jgi:methylphosphotriester-DNA--protein-cysteine methyltransferase